MTLSSRAKALALAGSAAIVIWAAWDLYGPRSTDLRDFNPDAVASLETQTWRSYYDRERLRLFSQLATLMHEQYRMPLLRSYVEAYHAAHAAVVFQDGRSRADYEKALPDLETYYAAIRRMSTQPFDPDRAARLELEWWIIHRQRDQHPRADLDRSLADLQAELFHLPSDLLAEHGRNRAEAMLIRDAKAAANGKPAGEDWRAIDDLLHSSWRSLWTVVNNSK